MRGHLFHSSRSNGGSWLATLKIWSGNVSDDQMNSPLRSIIVFVIRRDFGRDALRFALSHLLILLSLLFIPSGACRPVSFKTISPVIRPECHSILLSRVDIDCCEPTYT